MTEHVSYVMANDVRKTLHISISPLTPDIPLCLMRMEGATLAKADTMIHTLAAFEMMHTLSEWKTLTINPHAHFKRMLSRIPGISPADDITNIYNPSKVGEGRLAESRMQGQETDSSETAQLFWALHSLHQGSSGPHARIYPMDKSGS